MISEDCQQEIENIRSQIEQLLTQATEKAWGVETIDEKWSVKFICRCGAIIYQTRYIELSRLKSEELKNWTHQFAYEIYAIYNKNRFDDALKGLESE